MNKMSIVVVAAFALVVGTASALTETTVDYDNYKVETTQPFSGSAASVHADSLKDVKPETFRVTPYLQHPTENAMTVKWFTEGDAPATISWWTDGEAAQSLTTTPDEATELYYSDTDISSYNSRTGYSGIERGPIQTIPWHHRARLTGLKAGTTYHYRVDLAGGVSYENTFRTVPDRNTPVRFLCYSDSETEPESTGKFEDWEKPPQGSSFHPNKYFVDSTVGYASNIVHMIKRNPDFYLIAGDLVQYGYEQRDWDEFWRHNAGVRNDPAGSAPIFAAPGNHDYVSSGINGDNRANYDGGEAAISRYLKYFEYPSNGVDFGDGGPDRSQLFYRQDYGRVTVISIDTNNGDDSDPDKDSCTVLYRDASKVPSEYAPTAGQAPCRAPDFNPGTPQFNWLTNQLADAQAKGQFIFVLNHHMPHSVGYHNRHNHYSSRSYSDGTYEPYSAVAVRVLQPYLLKYGVAAWICGHDEINEHSVVSGTETLPDGSTRSASLNIFDVGNSGDGLRGGGANGETMRGEANPYEFWRAHINAPEIYNANGVLTEGGKHYGHLEINVEPDGDSGDWKCTMTPVHVFVNKVNGQAATFERREYDNVVTVVKSRPALPEGYRYDSDGNIECRVTVAPGAGGGVKVNGQPTTDEVWALQGATVTLTAENSGTTVFDKWTGDTSTIVSGFANSPEIKVVLSAPLALAATWTTTKYRYWNPTVQTQSGTSKFYYWTTAANWRDAAGATGMPASGDTVIFGSDSKGSAAYRVSNDSTANPLYEVCFSNKTTVSVNQGSFALKAGGKGLQYLRNANNTGNWSGIRLCGDGEVPVHIGNNVTYAMQKACLLGNGKPTVVKTGPGTFVNCNEAGNYDYTAPTTLLREGTWDISITKVIDGCVIGFDGNDGSQVLQYGYASHSLPLQIKNGGIFETNGVANTTHAISANGKDQQVIFTGTPKFNPMVFSGRLIKGAGIKWSPSAADCTFVFSNAVSDTSGRILIDKGTVRLTCGASMTNLTEVSVAQAAVFEVEEGAGANFKAKALTLAGAEAKLKLGAGVALAFDAATLAGTALAAKTYSATGANGTQRVAWIEGEGTVTVATGPANADVWSGLGANNYTSTDGNWLNGVAPDVTEGGLLATFANGGSEAKIPANVAAKFAGLVLSPAFGDSSFTFSTDGGTAALAENGINSIAATNSPVVWTMGWPLEVATAQTWSLATNNALKVTAPISGSAALTVSGAGAIEFAATSTHSGAKEIAVPNVKIAADNALGTAEGAVAYHHVTSKLSFAGDITLDSPFYSSDQCETFASFMTVEPNSHVTFNGNFGYRAEGGITFGAGSVTTFRGGLKFATDGMKGRIKPYGSGTVVVTNKPISTCRSWIGQASHPITLVLAVTGNALNDVSYWAYFPCGRLVTAADNAVYNSNRLTLLKFEDAEFDLAGHDQQIELLSTTAKTRITSAAPARLVLLSTIAGSSNDGDAGGTNRVDLAVYSGQVSVEKGGGYPHVFGATSTSTGAVAVTKGVVTMNASGKWPNATEVRVAGGVVKLQNAEAFGTNAVWRVTAGAAPVVQLDYGGTNTCAKLYLDGLRQSSGVYGATGSGAAHEVGWISGSGFLNVTRRGLNVLIK